MKVLTVSYSELRSYGNYQNQTIGITMELEGDEPAATALHDAQLWVRQRLDETVQGRQAVELTAAEISQLEYRKRELTDDVATLQERWEKARAFLTQHGVDPSTLEALPF